MRVLGLLTLTSAFLYGSTPSFAATINTTALAPGVYTVLSGGAFVNDPDAGSFGTGLTSNAAAVVSAGSFYASAQAQLATQPSPGLRTQVAVQGPAAGNGGGADASAEVSYTYQFRINALDGGDGTVLTRVVASSGHTLTDGSDRGGQELANDLRLVITDATNQDVALYRDGVFTYDDRLSFSANTIYNVTLYAFEEVSTAQGTMSASSYIDPYFSIDPSVASRYALAFSAGVSNDPPGLSPVPLPASAPLFGMALLTIGWVSRRSMLRRMPTATPVKR